MGYLFPTPVAEVWPPIFPKFRFTEWQSLAKPIQQISKNSLSYKEETWNRPLTNEEVEYVAFSSLNEKQQRGAGTIGFDEITWDCWVNHYYGYDWSELITEEVVGCYEALGWTQSVWDNAVEESAYPDSESKAWTELSEQQRDGATRLCFFEDLWDADLTGMTVARYSLPVGSGKLHRIRR